MSNFVWPHNVWHVVSRFAASYFQAKEVNGIALGRIYRTVEIKWHPPDSGPLFSILFLFLCTYNLGWQNHSNFSWKD